MNRFLNPGFTTCRVTANLFRVFVLTLVVGSFRMLNRFSVQFLTFVLICMRNNNYYSKCKMMINKSIIFPCQNLDSTEIVPICCEILRPIIRFYCMKMEKWRRINRGITQNRHSLNLRCHKLKIPSAEVKSTRNCRIGNGLVNWGHNNDFEGVPHTICILFKYKYLILIFIAI